jgi:NitT/TauT family transport system permease protein
MLPRRRRVGEKRVSNAKGRGAAARLLNAAWLRPFILLIMIIVAWDLSIRVFHIPAYQIPAPGDVVKVLWTDWPELLSQTWPTTYATIAGFLLSALFGVPVAMLIAGSRTVESYVYPLLVFSQSIPKVAIAPLFVVWFGFGIVPKIIAAFLLGFFPVVVSAVQGFKSVDPDMVDLARAMKGSRFSVFCAVNLPRPCSPRWSSSRCSACCCSGSSTASNVSRSPGTSASALTCLLPLRRGAKISTSGPLKGRAFKGG